MKTPITIVSSILIIILFSNCASSQFDKKPPFLVKNAKYQNWIGGKPGSKGTLITIEFNEKANENIQFDTLYFNDTFIPLKVDIIDNKTTLSGNFITSSSRDKLIIMDKNPKKEFGNEAPSLSKKSPFTLAKNECVISYTIKDKTHYFMIDTLQKGKTIIYP